MSVPPTNQVYQGYAALSRYISGVDGLHVFHRFGELHTRNLLYLQDELRDLEETLHGRDLQPDIEHGSRRSDGDADRRRLMLLIKTKLKEYGKHRLSIRLGSRDVPEPSTLESGDRIV